MNVTLDNSGLARYIPPLFVLSSRAHALLWPRPNSASMLHPSTAACASRLLLLY